jgi:hypothetical protein
MLGAASGAAVAAALELLWAPPTIGKLVGATLGAALPPFVVVVGRRRRIRVVAAVLITAVALGIYYSAQLGVAFATDTTPVLPAPLGISPPGPSQPSAWPPDTPPQNSRPTSVAVPPVVGKPLRAAKGLLEKTGLVAGPVSAQASNTVPEGNVISSDPAVGAEVNKGSAVSLMVSSGPAPCVVPAVVGKKIAKAREIIKASCVTVGDVVEQPSTAVPKGDVISSNPAGGIGVENDRAVSLAVSSGPKAP